MLGKYSLTVAHRCSPFTETCFYLCVCHKNNWQRYESVQLIFPDDELRPTFPLCFSQCSVLSFVQLVSGLYTVVGMPGDTLAQVVQSAMAKVTTPSDARKMQRRLFKVAFFASALAACTAAGVTAIRKSSKVMCGPFNDESAISIHKMVHSLAYLGDFESKGRAGRAVLQLGSYFIPDARRVFFRSGEWDE